MEKLNNNLPTFTRAVSSEDVLNIVQQKYVSQESLTALTGVVQEIDEKPNIKTEVVKEFLGETTKTVKTLTYNGSIDCDHWLRQYFRTVFGQRLLHTSAKNDCARGVELPPGVHVQKERMSFREPLENFNYTNGIYEFLDILENRTHEIFDNCTPSDLQNVPSKYYKRGYTQCHQEITSYLNKEYSELTSVEKFMVFHAKVCHLSNEVNIENFLENQCSPLFPLDDKFDDKMLRESVVGQALIKNTNLTADFTRQIVEKRGAFVNTLIEISSPECRKILTNLQESHKLFLQWRFDEIGNLSHKLTSVENQNLLSPKSLTFDQLSNFVENTFDHTQYRSLRDWPTEIIHQALYKYANHLGLTDIGGGLPTHIKILNLQKQRVDIERFGLMDITKFEKLNAANIRLEEKLNEGLFHDETILVFDSKEAKEFHEKLTQSEPCLPKSLANLLVKNYGITDLDVLRKKTEEKDLLKETGFGLAKLGQVEEFFSSLDNKKLEENLTEFSQKPTKNFVEIEQSFHKNANEVFSEKEDFKLIIPPKNEPVLQKLEITSKTEPAQRKPQSNLETDSEKTERERIVGGLVHSIFKRIAEANQ